MYVDDIVMLAVLMAPLVGVKGHLKQEFKMKDPGEAKFILGMEIRRQENGDIFLVQEKYARDILRKYNMYDCSPVGTPLEIGTDLGKNGCPTTVEERIEMAEKAYLHWVAMGSLIYIAQGTRPDMSEAVSTLSSFNQDPGRVHWEL